MVLHRILQWLRDNYARTVDLFHKLDSNQDNYLSCDEFVTGMRMLEVGIVLQMQCSKNLLVHLLTHDLSQLTALRPSSLIYIYINFGVRWSCAVSNRPWLHAYT